MAFILIPHFTKYGNIDFLSAVESFKPIREIFLYRIFIISAISLQAISLYLFKDKLNSDQFRKSLIQFISIELILTVLIFYGFFRMSIGDFHETSQILLYGALLITLLTKIFWMPLKDLDLIENCLNWFQTKKGGLFLNIAANCSIPLLLIATIMIPDIEGLKAVVYTMDNFYHFDSFVMSPGWAYLKGLTLNVDTLSIYGVGLPIILSKISLFLGGFTYENILLIMLWMMIAYGMMYFGLLRLLTKDVLIALIGIILFLKWQLFNNDQFFLVYPNRMVVRIFWDVPFFLSLLTFLRQEKKVFLMIASCFVGMALFYVYDHGVYLLITYLFFLLFTLSNSHFRKLVFCSTHDIKWLMIYTFLPIVTCLLLLGIFNNNAVVSIDFWRNIIHLITDLSSTGAIAYNYNLSQSHFLMFFNSLVPPFIYLFTIICVGGMTFFKKTSKDNVFIVTLCVYGLCVFHYHVWRSIDQNYYVGSVPYIIILCFWMSQIKQSLKPELARVLLRIILLVSFFGLLTNPFFMKCPNILNQKTSNFDFNKRILRQTLNIDKDAAMISKYSEPNERIFLVSSFETAILMMADRAPLFFRFPQLTSKMLPNMKKKIYGGTNFFQGDEDPRGMKRTYELLRTDKSAHVFIEKKLMANLGNVKDYIGKGHYLTVIKDYIKENYVLEAEQGKYLFVLKRKKGK